jgi:hypothetical protein
MKLFTREELLPVARSHPEVLVDIILALQERLVQLEQRVQELGSPTGLQQFQQRQAAIQRWTEQTQPQEFARAQRSQTRRPTRSSGPYLAAGQKSRSH